MEQFNQNEMGHLDAIRQTANEKFGEDTWFTYIKDGNAYTMTLDEAIDVCGVYIATASVTTAVGMLEGMYITAQRLQTSAERFDASRERSSALLAHIAMRNG